MIHSVSLHNFQSYRDVTLLFDNGVNIIKGRSHSGKSVLIRALYWCFTHNLRGDGFRSTLAKANATIWVEVEFTNGVVLRKTKSTKGTMYTVTERASGVVQTYKALQSKVPEEIEELIAIPRCAFQTQFAGHFLLNESAGNVAKELNSVVGLDIIGKATNSINSIRSAQQNILGAQFQKKQEFTSVLDKYSFIDDLNASVRNVTTEYGTYTDGLDEITQISEIVESVLQCDAELESLLLFDTIKQYLEEVDNYVASYNENAQHFSELDELLSELSSVQAKISKHKRYANILPLWNTAQKILGKFNVKKTEYENLFELYTDLKNVEEELADIDSFYVDLAKEYEDVQNLVNEYLAQNEKFKDMNAICWQVDTLDSQLPEIYDDIAYYESQIGKMCPTCGRPYEEA